MKHKPWLCRCGGLIVNAPEYLRDCCEWVCQRCSGGGK